MEPDAQRTLVRFMLLSIATAIVTIGLKFAAAAITGSVGLLSDAIESVVNLVAAVVALWAIKVAVRTARPRAPLRPRQGRVPVGGVRGRR